MVVRRPDFHAVRTCQKLEGARCGFFLWDDHAQPREQTVLMHNSRSEPNLNDSTTPARHRPSPSPPPYWIERNPSESTRKRPHPHQSDSDDYGLEQTDDAFNSELNLILAEAETPSKAVKTSRIATPANARRKLPWQMDRPPVVAGSSHRGLQTPQTYRQAASDTSISGIPTIGASLFTPAQAEEKCSGQTATPESVLDTPTPTRFKNMGSDDLINDMLHWLQDANTRLGLPLQTELRTLLSKHAKNAEGYKRGRDVMRTTVQAKNAKITELNFRIRTLEAELEAERAMYRHLQWTIQSDSPIT